MDISGEEKKTTSQEKIMNMVIPWGRAEVGGLDGDGSTTTGTI